MLLGKKKEEGGGRLNIEDLETRQEGRGRKRIN